MSCTHVWRQQLAPLSNADTNSGCRALAFANTTLRLGICTGNQKGQSAQQHGARQKAVAAHSACLRLVMFVAASCGEREARAPACSSRGPARGLSNRLRGSSHPEIAPPSLSRREAETVGAGKLKNRTSLRCAPCCVSSGARQVDALQRQHQIAPRPGGLGRGGSVSEVWVPTPAPTKAKLPVRAAQVEVQRPRGVRHEPARDSRPRGMIRRQLSSTNRRHHDAFGFQTKAFGRLTGPSRASPAAGTAPATAGLCAASSWPWGRGRWRAAQRRRRKAPLEKTPPLEARLPQVRQRQTPSLRGHKARELTMHRLVPLRDYASRGQG